MSDWLSNPVTYILALAVGTAIVKILWWIRDVTRGEKDFRVFVKEIKDDMKTIREHITDIFKRLPDPVIAGASPFQLTDLGRKLSAELGAEEWAANLAPTLSDDVAGKKPFQIDEYAEKYVRDNLSDEMVNLVAACAYDAGRTREDVLPVLCVVLRDELIRLGISEDDE